MLQTLKYGYLSSGYTAHKQGRPPWRTPLDPEEGSARLAAAVRRGGEPRLKYDPEQ
eukprot:bmy_19794T0